MMPFDIDQTMLVYLGMITAGIFIFPFWSDTIPYLYQIIGTGLVAAGGFLVYYKSRKR
ncbi:protein of unknown function [Candidatus Nitrosotalea okcheonensis]|uniref:Uncharacterized protein n=2 Tax=Candidatus Nitrosotalea okcheonensis TaxID=1903276 RepID=A0A2H1FGB0_9ARCH|nr:protein of unknown function [Candidatus Nitrosotalea okcheonensis]